MVMIWPFIHAFLAALITTWDVLPPTSKAYDLVPEHIQAKLGRNATLDKVVKEWVKDTWRWGEPAKNPSVALTWVNGINYTSAEVEEQAHFLSTLFGCRVRPYYNPSLGGWLRDLTRVSYMYIRAPTEDPVVTGLAKHLSMVLREVGPRGRVVHLAHSGGALLTYLVAKYHLKEEDRRRIDVVNFGGARSITQKYVAKATNYYARNDPILLVNRRAMALMQQVLKGQSDGEVIYLKHNTSFVFLQGRAGDALADHSFVGPTYLTALQREAAVFRRAYYRAYWLDALMIAKPPEMGWGRYLRKRTAAATGFHNFFSNSTLGRALADSTAYKYLAYPYSYSAFKRYYEAQRQASLARTNSTATYVLRLPRRIYKGARKRARRYLQQQGWGRGGNATEATAAALQANASRTGGVAAWFPTLLFFPPGGRDDATAGVAAAEEEEPPPSLLARVLSNSSSISLAAASEELSLRLRRVRKAAARATGVRGFFNKEKRLQKLLQERRPLLSPPAVEEPPQEQQGSRRGWPFFRGSRVSDGKEEGEAEEEEQPPIRPPSLREREKEELQAAAEAAVAVEEVEENGTMEEKDKAEKENGEGATVAVPPMAMEGTQEEEGKGEGKGAAADTPGAVVVAVQEEDRTQEAGAAVTEAPLVEAAAGAARPPSPSPSGFFLFRGRSSSSSSSKKEEEGEEEASGQQVPLEAAAEAETAVAEEEAAVEGPVSEDEMEGAPKSAVAETPPSSNGGFFSLFSRGQKEGEGQQQPQQQEEQEQQVQSLSPEEEEEEEEEEAEREQPQSQPDVQQGVNATTDVAGAEVPLPPPPPPLPAEAPSSPSPSPFLFSRLFFRGRGATKPAEEEEEGKEEEATSTTTPAAEAVAEEKGESQQAVEGAAGTVVESASREDGEEKMEEGPGDQEVEAGGGEEEPSGEGEEVAEAAVGVAAGDAPRGQQQKEMKEKANCGPSQATEGGDDDKS